MVSMTMAWANRDKVVTALRLVGIPIGLSVLVVWAIDKGAADSVENANHFLLFGLIVSQASILVFAYRFRRILRIGKINLTFSQAYKLHLQSLFYFFFVPLSVGSEVSKVVKLSFMFPEVGKKRFTVLVMLDKMVGFLSFAFISAVTFPFVAPSFKLSASVGLMLVLGIILCAAAFLWSLGRLFNRQRYYLALIHVARSNKRYILDAGILSICMQSLMVIAGYLAALGWGLTVSLVDVGFALSGAFLFQVVPLSVGGAGGAEIAGVALYMLIGVSAKGAVLIASTLYLYRLVGAFLGGVCEMVCKNKTREIF